MIGLCASYGVVDVCWNSQILFEGFGFSFLLWMSGGFVRNQVVKF